MARHVPQRVQFINRLLRAFRGCAKCEQKRWSRGRKACTRPPRLKGRGSFPKNSARCGFRSVEQRESGGPISMVGKRFQGPRELSAREVTRARSASPRARLARSKSLHNRPTTSSINARSTSSIKLRLVVSKRCKRLFHTKIRILRKLLSLLLHKNRVNSNAIFVRKWKKERKGGKKIGERRKWRETSRGRKREKLARDSPRWPSCLMPGPTPALCFASNLSFSPVLIVPLPPLSAPFPCPSGNRASGHRIRWADAYESRCSRWSKWDFLAYGESTP